jgi:hypothetical protein
MQLESQLFAARSKGLASGRATIAEQEGSFQFIMRQFFWETIQPAFTLLSGAEF